MQKIKFQPGFLSTRRYFSRHWDERFRCPLLKSIIFGLVGFQINDIDYSQGLHDNADTVCFDFKEQ